MPLIVPHPTIAGTYIVKTTPSEPVITGSIGVTVTLSANRIRGTVANPGTISVSVTTSVAVASVVPSISPSDSEITVSAVTGSGTQWAFTITAAKTGATSNLRMVSVNVTDSLGTHTGVGAAGFTVNNAPPPAPTGVTASPITRGVALSWTLSSSTYVNRYNIYYNTSATPADGSVKTLLGSTFGSSYTDSPLVVNTQRWYWVTAVDDVGNESVVSSQVNATAQGDIQMTLTLDKNRVGGSATVNAALHTSAPIQSSWLQLSASPSDSNITFGSIVTTDTQNYTFTVIVNKTTPLEIVTRSIITQLNTALSGGQSGAASALLIIKTSLPGTVTGVTVSPKVQSARVTWAATGDTDLARYEVYRTLTNSAPTLGTPYGTTVDTAFLDSVLVSNTLYYYWVRAVDQTGNFGALSAAGSGTTLQILGTDIQNLAIGTGLLADTAVTTGKLFDGAVVTAKLGDLQVTLAKIADKIIDNTKLVDYTIGNLQLALNAVQSGNLLDGAVLTNKIAANAVVVSKLTVTDFTNLAENPGFEIALPVGWTADARWTFVTPSGTAYAGTKVAQLAPGGAGVWATLVNNNTVACAPTTVPTVPPTVAPQSFYAEVQVLRTGLTNGSVQLYFSFVDKTGAEISTPMATALTDTIPVNTWTPMSLTADAPANTAGVRVVVRGQSTAAFWQADNVIMRRRNAGELLVDGSIGANQIAANAIVAGKINALAVTFGTIDAGAVRAAEIHAGAITASHIVTGGLDASVITAGTITTDRMLAGTINADRLVAASITTDKLASRLITATKLGIVSAVVEAGSFTNNSPSPGYVSWSGLRIGINGTFYPNNADLSQTFSGSTNLPYIWFDQSTNTVRGSNRATAGGATPAASGTLDGDFDPANDVLLGYNANGSGIFQFYWNGTLIKGDQIVTGSITAKHIGVNTLAALTADIGVITAGRLQDALDASSTRGVRLTRVGLDGTTYGKPSGWSAGYFLDLAANTANLGEDMFLQAADVLQISLGNTASGTGPSATFKGNVTALALSVTGATIFTGSVAASSGVQARTLDIQPSTGGGSNTGYTNPLYARFSFSGDAFKALLEESATFTLTGPNTTTQVTDTNRTFTPDALADGETQIIFRSGVASGLSRTITACTATTINFAAVPTAPAAGDTYVIQNRKSVFIGKYGAQGSGSSTTTPSDNSWSPATQTKTVPRGNTTSTLTNIATGNLLSTGAAASNGVYHASFTIDINMSGVDMTAASAGSYQTVTVTTEVWAAVNGAAYTKIDSRSLQNTTSAGSIGTDVSAPFTVDVTAAPTTSLTLQLRTTVVGSSIYGPITGTTPVTVTAGPTTWQVVSSASGVSTRRSLRLFAHDNGGSNAFAPHVALAPYPVAPPDNYGREGDFVYVGGATKALYYHNGTNWVVTGTGTVAGSVAWSAITNKPTTLSGFGITDAYTQAQSDARYPSLTGTGASGTWSISITGNAGGNVTGTAGSISGWSNPPTASTGGTWPQLAGVKSDGSMEIGRYIDFHNTSADGIDYAVRLETGGTSSGLTINSSQILTAGNYNSYSPTLTGGGASGTWNITIGTASQPNITALGTLLNLTVTNTISGSVSGNAGTATKLATATTINGVAFDGSAPITVAAAAGTLTGTALASGVTASSLTSVGTLLNLTVTNTISGSVSGNAGTATALFTPRTINGVSFDGTANITVTAAAGTLTGTTLNPTVVTSSLTSVGTLGSLAVGTGGVVVAGGGASIAGSVSFTHTGGTNATLLGPFDLDNTYNYLSFNGLNTAAGIGFVAGGATDKALYYEVPTGGSHQFRINRSTIIQITGSTLFANVLALTGVLQMANGVQIQAKNSTGTYDDVFFARGTDNNTYLNYGSGGTLFLRNNTNVIKAQLTDSALTLTGGVVLSAATVGTHTFGTTGTGSGSTILQVYAQTTSGSAQLLLNGAGSAVKWQSSAVDKFSEYMVPSDNNLYLRDLANARMQVTYTPGATNAAAITTFSSQVIASGDLTVGSLGVFNSALSPANGNVLVYDTTNSKWNPRNVQFTLGSADTKVSLGTDSTAYSYIYDSVAAGAGVGTPSTPTAGPVLTAGHKAITVDFSAYANVTGGVTVGSYEIDYATNSGFTGAVTVATTSMKFVHSLLTTGTTYYYRFRAKGASLSGNSPVASLAAINNSSASAFGSIIASEIAVASLSAIKADLGTINAGLILNNGSTPTAALRLSSGYVLPTSVTTYIDLAFNQAGGTGPFIQSAPLSVDATSATIRGTVTATSILFGRGGAYFGSNASATGQNDYTLLNYGSMVTVDGMVRSAGLLIQRDITTGTSAAWDDVQSRRIAIRDSYTGIQLLDTPVIATATSGTTTSITDSARVWGVDQFRGLKVRVLNGSGVLQFTADITGNTATTISYATQAVTPVAGWTFQVQNVTNAQMGSYILAASDSAIQYGAGWAPATTSNGGAASISSNTSMTAAVNSQFSFAYTLLLDGTGLTAGAQYKTGSVTGNVTASLYTSLDNVTYSATPVFTRTMSQTITSDGTATVTGTQDTQSFTDTVYISGYTTTLYLKWVVTTSQSGRTGLAGGSASGTLTPGSYNWTKPGTGDSVRRNLRLFSFDSSGTFNPAMTIEPVSALPDPTRARRGDIIFVAGSLNQLYFHDGGNWQSTKASAPGTHGYGSHTYDLIPQSVPATPSVQAAWTWWNNSAGRFEAGTAAATVKQFAWVGDSILSANVSAGTFTGAFTFSSTISGSITGNAGTATTLQNSRNINGVLFNGSADITVTAAAGTLTGTTLAAGITASSLTSVGTLTGLSVTAAISGSITGNAGTATKLAAAVNINGVAFDGSAPITVTAAAGTLTGATLAAGITASSLTSVGTLTGLSVTATISGSITGNAGTATTLQNSRNINGVLFNGSADITVTAAAGTLTGATLAAGITSSSLTSLGTLTSLAISQAQHASTGLTITNADTTTTDYLTEAALHFKVGGVNVGSLKSTAKNLIGLSRPSLYLFTDSLADLAFGVNTAATPAMVIDGSSGAVTISNGLTVTGGSGITGTIGTSAQPNITSVGALVGLTIASGGLRQYGSAIARFENTFGGVPTGSVGTAVELGQSGGTGIIQSYDRTAGAYSPLQFGGSSYNFLSGTVSMVGLSVTGTISGAITGNAGTATKLQNARTINGVSFDGSANISVAVDASALTGNTLATGILTSSLTQVGTLTSLTVTGTVGATLFSGALGQGTQGSAQSYRLANDAGSPYSARLVFGTDNTGWKFAVTKNVSGALTDLLTVQDNGIVVATTFQGSLSGNAATTTKLLTPVTINGASFDGSAAITVTAAAGTLTGSALAASVTVSSLTSLGTLTGLAVTNSVAAGTYGVNLNGASGAARDILLVGQAGFSNGLTVQYNGSAMVYKMLDGSLTLNNGTISATGLSAGATGITGTLVTAAQPNITSIGTLTALSVSGNFTSGQAGTGTGGGYFVKDDSGTTRWASGILGASAARDWQLYDVVNSRSVMAVSSANGSVSFPFNVTVTGTFTGTLATAAQPNITAVGTLVNLTSAGDITLQNHGTSSRYILTNEDNTGTGVLFIQAGLGSAAYGGSVALYAAAHATKPGYVEVGLGSASARKFQVATGGIGTGGVVFSVDQGGNGQFLGTLGVTGGITGYSTTSQADALYARLALSNTIEGNLFANLPSVGPVFTTSNPELQRSNIWYSAIATGKPLFSDEEFALGLNSVIAYNNGTGGITITRNVDASAPNSTGYSLTIAYDGTGAPSPGLGGFYQVYNAHRNAIIVQRFRAKIPVSYSVNYASNSMGTNANEYWITPTVGTGKWQEYIRVVVCGNTGTFSNGGHVYLTGPAGAVTWYLASCTAFEPQNTGAVIAGGVNGLALGQAPGHRRITYGSASGTAFSLLTDADGYADLYMNSAQLAGGLSVAAGLDTRNQITMGVTSAGAVLGTTRRLNWGDFMLGYNLRGIDGSDSYATHTTHASAGYSGVNAGYAGTITLFSGAGATTAGATITPTAVATFSTANGSTIYGGLTLTGTVSLNGSNNITTTSSYMVINPAAQLYLRAGSGAAVYIGDTNAVAVQIGQTGGGAYFNYGSSNASVLGINGSLIQANVPIAVSVASGTAAIKFTTAGSGDIHMSGGGTLRVIDSTYSYSNFSVDNAGNGIFRGILSVNGNLTPQTDIVMLQNQSIYHNSAGSDYTTAALMLRERGHGGSNSYEAPRLAFHWGGVVASQISIETGGSVATQAWTTAGVSGRIAVINNPGTGYESFKANQIYAAGGFKLDGGALDLNTGGLANNASGISFYGIGYTAWQDYMAPPGVANKGATGTVNPSAGSYVTSWARRSFIESTSGYGWIWESGGISSTTPGIIMELSSVGAGSSQLKVWGDITARRAATTGVVYFGDSAAYIYYNGTSFDFSGKSIGSIASVTTTGAVSAASASLTGAMSSASASISGNATMGSATITGALNGSTGSLSGTMQADTYTDGLSHTMAAIMVGSAAPTSQTARQGTLFVVV